MQYDEILCYNVSVFNYSEKYGGTFDSFKYYNDYVIELGDE